MALPSARWLVREVGSVPGQHRSHRVTSCQGQHDIRTGDVYSVRVLNSTAMTWNFKLFVIIPTSWELMLPLDTHVIYLLVM
jgi:hypothetical protein